MSISRKLLNTAANICKKSMKIAGKKRGDRIASFFSEHLVVNVTQHTKRGDITFYCPGELPAWRAETLLTKEPETINWIDGFNDADIFWDIGANVGCYSLYAAKKGHATYSFEPSPINFFLLSKNIEINKLDDRISSYCLALSEKTELGTFFLNTTEFGSALNNFGSAVDFQGNSFSPSLKQAMIGFSIDDFIKQFSPPIPNHIKIDVDGLESEIIKGGRNTLANQCVKSIMVELDTKHASYNKVQELLGQCGYKQLSVRAHQFETDAPPDIYNHFFIRV